MKIREKIVKLTRIIQIKFPIFLFYNIFQHFITSRALNLDSGHYVHRSVTTTTRAVDPIAPDQEAWRPTQKYEKDAEKKAKKSISKQKESNKEGNDKRKSIASR